MGGGGGTTILNMGLTHELVRSGSRLNGPALDIPFSYMDIMY